MTTFGRSIRAARRRAGLTQQRLADETLVDWFRVNCYERDCYQPNIWWCEDAADVLRCSIDELLGYEHIPCPGPLKSPKENRRSAGLSQLDLALSAGVARRTISTIEDGSHVPKAAIVVRVAHALGMGIDEYLGHEVILNGSC